MRLLAWRDVPRLLPLMRDPAVPLAMKVAAVGVALLILSPVDVLGDIPVIGLLDDAVLLALLVHLFVWIAERSRPRPVVMRDVTPTSPETHLPQLNSRHR